MVEGGFCLLFISSHSPEAASISDRARRGKVVGGMLGRFQVAPKKQSKCRAGTKSKLARNAHEATS
jgi:hypothetical protein